MENLVRDEKWCQLCSSKNNLKKLFLKVQQRQFDRLKKQPDEPLSEDTRLLEEQDIKWCVCYAVSVSVVICGVWLCALLDSLLWLQNFHYSDCMKFLLR